MFLPGKCHGQRSLAGYSPWAAKSQTQPSDWTHTQCPSKKGKFGQINTEGRYREKMAIHKHRREAWNRPFPCSPQEEPTLLTPSSETFSFRNCEAIQIYCLSHSICGSLLWQPEETDTNSISMKIKDSFWKLFLLLTQRWIRNSIIYLHELSAIDVFNHGKLRSWHPVPSLHGK